MARNNDVFQVLVARSILSAPNAALDTLVPNQIGIFDAETNLSINPAAPPKKFYIAVGVGNAAGQLIGVNKSSGQHIQHENIKFYNAKRYTPGAPEILEITGFTPKCNTDFAIKIEFRNQKVYNQQGYNQFSKTFVVRTPCCGNECDICAPQDPNILVNLFLNEINKQERPLVLAEAIDPTTGLVITDMDAFIAAHSAVNTDDDPTNDVVARLRLTTIPLEIQNFCDINLLYYNPRETVVVVSLIDGFECSGTVTVIQDPIFEEGSGYDVRKREFFAGGWNGRPGPYRVSTANNTASSNPGFTYFSEIDVNYDRINLTYDLSSFSGFSEYINHLATEVYFPTGTSLVPGVALSFATLLDQLLPRFAPQAGNL